jgi:hypothetical protein
LNDYESREKRDTSRRANDIIDRSEIRLLRHEIETLGARLAELRITVDNEETQDDMRISGLEKEVAELQSKLSGVKGILYGFGVTVSYVFYLVVDRVKELFIK